MDCAEIICVTVSCRSFPYNFRAKLAREQLIQQSPGQVTHVGRQVQEDRAAIGQQLSQHHQPAVQHLQVAPDALAPGVAVGLLLDHRGDLGQVLVGPDRVITDGDADLVILAGVERRVDVDEVYLPGEPVDQRGGAAHAGCRLRSASLSGACSMATRPKVGA